MLRLPRRLFDKLAPCALTGCWFWLGSTWGRDRRRGGEYGQVRDGGRRRAAHVVIYEILIGPVPAGYVLDHVCRQRLCCNPWHVEPVTNAENVRRGYASRRRAAA